MASSSTPAVAPNGSGSPGGPCAAPWSSGTTSGASLAGSPAASAGTSGEWAGAAAEFRGHCATTASGTEASGTQPSGAKVSGAKSSAVVSRAAGFGSLRQTQRRTRRPLRCSRLAGSTKANVAQGRQAVSITNQGPRASFRHPTPDPLTNWKPASHRRRNVRIYGKSESDGQLGLGRSWVTLAEVMARLWGTTRYGDHGGLTVPSKAGLCPTAGGVLEGPCDLV